MAGTATLTITSIPTEYMTFTISVNDGSKNINITMLAVNTRFGKNQFIIGSTIGETISNMAYYFNLDHSDVGGTDNLTAIATGLTPTSGDVVITLVNANWQIVSAGVQGFGTATFENEPIPAPKDFTYQLVSGDCTNADYDLNIQGGTPPFTISRSGTFNVVTSSRTPNISILRGVPNVVTIVDSNSDQIGSKQIVPPKVLNESDFTIDLTQESGAKATVTPNVVLDDLLLPVTYSINDVDYNSTGVFSSLSFETQYTLYIQDTFGCKRQKIFITPQEITNGDTVTTNYERHFEISNGGSGIFSRLTESPSNFNDSLSFEEKVKLPYETTIFQYKDWNFIGQFKSSYNYHKITLIENGSATYIDPVLQVQNLGLQEKVDCKLFRDVNGALGVYFRNGANYVPNTTTTDGTSDYDATNLPSWGRTGTTVVIDGIGSIKIKRVTTDNTRGLYLQTNASYSSNNDADGKIQANYNAQPYNTYEYIFPISNIDNCARIIIEIGFDIAGQSNIELTYGSERIQKITDKKGFLDFSWRDPENKSGMVHQTGIISRLLLPYIKWVGNSESTSELFDTDSESVSLKQDVKDVKLLIATVIGFKMQQKLQIAAGMEEFNIDGINYKKREMTSTPLKSSNWYRIEATFEFGSNKLEVNPDEIVLNPPSTPITNKGPQTTLQPSPLILSGGKLINENGNTILMED